MRTVIRLSLLIGIWFPSMGQVSLDWFNIYTLPGSFAGSIPNDLTRDSTGNLIACGALAISDTEQTVLGIVKYAPDGSLLWDFNFTLGPEYPATARALAVSTNGDIFVTGNSNDTAITFKLSAAGELLWLQKYATAKYWNYGKDIAIIGDTAIIVCGEVENDKVILLRYDQDGNLIWENYQEKAFYYGFNYMRIDIASDIYIGFEKLSPDENMDIGIAKYDVSGNLLLSSVYSTDNLNAFIKDMEIGPDGSIYMLSRSYGNDMVHELIKYNPEGEFSWKLFLDDHSPYNYFDFITEIGIDNNGNILAIGPKTDTYCDHDSLRIVKFSPGGYLLWKQNFPRDECTTDWGFDIVTDQFGNSYAISNNNAGEWLTSRYMLVLKYGPAGNLIWQEEFEQLTIPISVQVYNDEVLILAYVSDETTPDAISVIKYTQEITMSLEESIQSTNVFPVPATHFITFNSSEIVNPLRFDTYDLCGNHLNVKIEMNKEVDISGLTNGIYFTLITLADDSRITMKWCKQQ